MSSKGRKSLLLLLVEGAEEEEVEFGKDAPLLRRAGTPPPPTVLPTPPPPPPLPLPLPFPPPPPLPCLRSLILISSALPPPPPTLSPRSLGSDGENSRSDRTVHPLRRWRGSTVQAAACSKARAAASFPREDTEGMEVVFLPRGGGAGGPKRSEKETKFAILGFFVLFCFSLVVVERRKSE